MIRKEYNWNRYWVPRDGTFEYDLEGFLSDGTTIWAQGVDLVTLDRISDTPCLVLLGEPGIGKSFAMRAAQASARTGEGILLSVDLRSFGSEQRLIDEVFRSKQFSSWLAGAGNLEIILDSLDECLLRIDNVAAVLADQFSKINSVDGLKLRLACRTADWPLLLEAALVSQWGVENTKIFELAQLSRNQVEEAARANGIDSNAFVRELLSADVVPLAIKPLTLNFLLRLYEKDGRLPTSKAEIFSNGCRLLCEEPNESRLSAKQVGKFSVADRIAIATHIAAATVYCNKAAIWTGSVAQKPDTDLLFSDAAPRTIFVDGRRIDVSDSAIRETLGTGLFSSRGAQRLGWAHHSYSEFLAAKFGCAQNLTPRQLFSIIADADDRERHIIPQLRETAAWIAAENTTLRNHLLNIEPHVLLSSDISTAADAQKKALIHAILRRVANPVVWQELRAARRNYNKLTYKGMAKQLKPYLISKTQSNAHYEAIEIAQCCCVTELTPILAKNALDPKLERRVRVNAASAVLEIGNAQSKKELKPLALGLVQGDENDELRGAALLACWPQHISAQELFSSLKTPSRFGGYYRKFLREFPEKLSIDEAILALEWIERLGPQNNTHSPWEELIDSIFQTAVGQLANREIHRPFARAMLQFVRNNHIFPKGGIEHLRELLHSNAKIRRSLLAEFIPLIVDWRDSVIVARYGVPFACTDDVDWLFERLGDATKGSRRAICSVLKQVIQISDGSRADKLITAAQSYTEVAEIFDSWLRPRDLSDERTTKEREDYFEEKRLEARAAALRLRPQPAASNPEAQIIALLQQFEAGDFSAWSKIIHLMPYDDDGKQCEEFYSIDICRMPGWKRADLPTRNRLISAARRYINDGDPKVDEWFETPNVQFWPAVAGLCGLKLLSNCDVNYDQLPAKVWSKWAPVILQHPAYDEPAEHSFLVEQLLRMSKSSVLHWLPRLIRKESVEHRSLFVLSKFPKDLDDDITLILVNQASNEELVWETRQALLVFLLKKGNKRARKMVANMIPNRVPLAKESRDRIKICAEMLLPYVDEDEWSRMWRLANSDASFGRELIGSFAYTNYHAPSVFLNRLQPDQVAELFLWLFREFPPATDPRHDQAYTVTSNDAARSFRNHLVPYLAELGTVSARTALKKIMSALPKQKWVRDYLAHAEVQIRKKNWNPPEPVELFGLPGLPDASLVGSDLQLLDIVLDSLAMLQSKLQGETPRAAFLWDADKPVPEGKLTDFVKGHLEDHLKSKGVVVNREVEIRRGQKTDIHINAVTRRTGASVYDNFKLVIEVKGCWNRDLKTAIEKQLFKRYLKDNSAACGIYLVGWFPKAGWTNTDSRKRAVSFSSSKSLEDYLDAECARLTTDAKLVRSFVLNATVPETRVRKSAPKKRSFRLRAKK